MNVLFLYWISIQILTPAWLCSAVTTLLAISSSWTTRPCCCWTSGMICATTVTSSSLESSSREMFLAVSWNKECLNSYSLLTIILYHHLWGDRDRSERHHKECWLSLSLVMFPEIKMYRKKLKMLSLIGKPPKGAEEVQMLSVCPCVCVWHIMHYALHFCLRVPKCS